MRTLLKTSLLVLVSVVGFGCSARNNANYPYYGSGGNSAAVGIGVGAGLAALGLASGYGSYQQGETQRLAVVEGNKTQRKAIDANVLLNGACSMGGNGSTTYSSTDEVDGTAVTAKLKVEEVHSTPPCANNSVPPGATPIRQTSERLGPDLLAANGCYTFGPYIDMYRRGRIESNCPGR